MATNPSTLPENSGRITAPDANYPYGSAKDDSTGDTGDGTPIKKAWLNDTYGIIQAALRAAGTVPSGNAENATESQVLQAVNGLASGLANAYDDTGVADAYVLTLRTGQQKQPSLFDGLKVVFLAINGNTGPSTLDVSAALGQSAGTTIVPIIQEGAPLAAGAIKSNGFQELTYSSATASFEIRTSGVVSFVTGANGYVAFRGGLMIQWGSQTANLGVIQAVSFPTFFPNQLFNVQLTSHSSAYADAVSVVSQVTYSQAGFSFQHTSGGSSIDARWVAIGY